MPDLADFPDVVRRPVTRDIGANNPVVPSAPSDAEPDVLDQAAEDAQNPPSEPKPRVWHTRSGRVTQIEQPTQRDYEKYQSAMDRFNARAMLKAGREQERQLNVETGENLGQQRVITQKNPETGLTELARDEAGNIRYRTGKEPVQYDAAGKAVQTQITPTGPKQVEIDKDAEIGPHPDYPHQLFKQNKNAPWDFVSTVGEGLQSDDDKVRKAAEDAQLGLDKEYHGTALKTLGQNVYESAQKVKSAIAEASGKQQTLKDLQAQAAQLEPQSQQTEGGLFGMGKRPTSEAQAAKTKLDEVNAKIADFSQQGYGRLTGKGTLAEPQSVTDARKGHAAASAEKASWSSLKIDSLGQLDDVLQARESQILASGGDPEADPVIASIKARKKELGVETPTAQPSAEEQALREHPTFGPLMQERDQLTADNANAQKELDSISSDYDQRLQPTRDEIANGQNQIAPIQTQVDTYTARLEKLLGMPTAQPGEDLQVRRDEASQRISNLTDPETKARVQTVLNALEPAAAELRKAQADLQPTLQAHDALQNEAQQRIQTRQQELNDALTQRHADLTDRWNEAQNSEEQRQWNDTIKRQSQGWFDETKPAQVWNTKNEQIRARHLSDLPFDVAHQVGKIVDALFAPGEQSQHTIISPETAKFAASVAGLPARLVTSLMGTKEQSAEKGVEEGVAKFLSSVSLENIASLPVFLIPGVAQTYAAGLVAKLPEQFGQVKDAISAHGLFSKETAAAITENGITDVLGFLGLKGPRAAKVIGEKIAPETADLVKNAVAEAKKNGVSPEFRAFFGGIDPEVAGTTPEKVAAFAKSLGMEWKPGEKATAAPEPVAPTPADAHAEIDSLQMPGRTPEEHAATKNALRGLVKISQGQPIVSLTAAEKRALVSKATPEGTPRIEIVKGNAIISDATLARVAQIAPTVRSLLPENEEAQRQKLIAADQAEAAAKPTGKVQGEVSPPPERETAAPPVKAEVPSGTQPREELSTFDVEVQNAKGETTTATVEAPSAREAHAIIARQIPAGQGIVRDVTQVTEPTADFVERAVESAFKDKGSDLTEGEVKRTRVVARVLKPHYDRWAQAFSAVTTSLKENKTGGVALTGERALHISIPDVIRHANLYKDTPQHAANLMLHEAAHSVTTAAADKEIVDLWKEAPKSLRDAMKQFYKASDQDYNLAHEYWAYFLAGKAELAAGRRIRLAGKFLPEQSSRKFITENRRALARVLRFVRNAEAELKKSGKSAEYIAQWKNLEKLFVQKLNEVDGHAKETSKEVTPHETVKSNVPIEPSARGSPGSAAGGRTEPERVQSADRGAGTTRGVGRTGEHDQTQSQVAARAPEPDTGAQLSETRPGTTSEGLVGSTEAIRSASSTPTQPQIIPAEERPSSAPQLGRLSGEDRRTLAGSLGVPETALGGVSAITQNGRTIQVAYVAQEGARSRTSHDAQGRATPGYDQGLQPRDRSLPQYRKQSQNIANNLEFSKSAFFPETKTPATTADLGAPIMTRSGDTLVGNGREIGIKTAYQQGLSQAARYKSDFIRNARAFGIDPATVRDMAQPILKRVITGDVSKADLVRFSQESNEPAAMGRNAMELAGEDAGKLTPQLLSLFDPNYSVDSAKNRDFVRSYLQQVVGRGAEVNEANLTGSEVARRIRAAVFTYAYGADQTGRAALERLAGEEGAEGKTITNGMLTVAPIMARLRADVASGDLHAGMDISTSLTRAAQTIAKALTDKPQTQSAKAAVESLLTQGELFGQSQLDYETLKFLVVNRNKRTAIEEGLSNYAEAVYRIGNPKEGELFAGREVPTSLELFKRATTAEATAPKTDERRIAAQELQTALKSQPLQTFRAQDDAFASAERAKPAFDRQLEEIARVTGTRAITAPIKSRETAAAKVAADYSGDWSKIKDLVRGTIAVRDMAQARKVVGVLAQRFGVEPKRDFTQPLATGYRDALFNPIIDGHMAEIQVQIEPIVFVKDVAAHPLYERERAIKRQAKTENRQLSAQELRTVERLTLAQRRIYAAAFAGHIEAGISSTASEGLQGRAPSDLISSGPIGRGASPSKAQAFPSLSTTIAQGLGSPGTSRKDLAPGKAAIAASSVIPPSTTQTAAIEQPLSSQQLSLFGDAEPEATKYAKTLPAAAKASKPALKREVGKDVPELADNDAALDELVELAKPIPRPRTRADELGDPDISPATTPEPERASNAIIKDFGEKIGGARKDLAEKIGPRPAKPKDERPAWMRKYHVFEDARKPGEWVIGLTDGGLATRDSFPTREAAEAAIPLLEVSRNHDVRRSRETPVTPAEITQGQKTASEIEAQARQISELRDKNSGLLIKKDLTDRYRQSLANGKITQSRFDELKSNGSVLSDSDYAKAKEIEIQIDNLRAAPIPSAIQSTGETYDIVRRLGDRKHPVVKGGFKSREEALRYMAEHPEEIINHKFAFPEKPWLDSIERTAAPATSANIALQRKGDIAPESFREVFGFRAGEFGNWNMGSSGQAALNHAYDGLLDLADALEIDPKALSLNGDLAIAFGARGHGLQGAAAHYERDYAVINLTKIRGAGSAAHEWFHAFDHYLSRQDTKSSSEKTPAGTFKVSGNKERDYVSHGFSYKSQIRPELRDAFKAVMESMIRKNVTGEIDQTIAQKNETRMSEHVVSTLKDIRNQMVNSYQYSRTKKPPTENQLKRFDEAAAKIEKGDVGERKFIASDRNKFGGRETYQAIEDLNAIYKEVLGRSFATNAEGSLGKQVFWQLRSMFDAQERLAKATRGVTEVKSRPTDYFRESRKIDDFRASDYWSTMHEMGARSFEAFIADKLAAEGRRSDYLVHAADNKFYRIFDLRPYPEGEERTALDAAWQKVFDTIKQRPTGKGVALYAQPLARAERVRAAQNYAIALAKSRAASKEFGIVQKAYRAKAIGDEEFLAAKAKDDLATADFDKAFIAAQKAGVNETPDLTNMPFNLAGEEGVDWEARARAQMESEQRAIEAREIQDAAQTELFSQSIKGGNEPAAAEAEALRSQPVTVADRFRDNLPLAMKIAASYRNIRGVELGDIQQHARMALLRASRAFDPQRGLPFSALARQSINNELRNLYRQGGRLREDVSLDETPDVGGQRSEVSRKDQIADLSQDVRAQAALDETSAILESAINELPQRMQGAMAGILDGRTLDDIGQELGGISRQAVGKLATEAMRRLRGKLGERGVSKVSDLLSQPLNDREIVSAAYKTPDGKIHQARTHADMDDLVMRFGSPSVAGFMDRTGHFLTRDQAYKQAREINQIPETTFTDAEGKTEEITKLHTDDLEEGIAKMEKARAVGLLSQMIESELKAQTTDDPLEHLMSILKDDPIEALRDIPGIGRPDLALGATAAMRAVHEFHTDTATQQKLDQWDAEGKQIVADRGPEWVKDVTKRWLDGAVLEPSEVRATQQYILEHQADAMTPEDRRAFDTFAYAYTKIGERTARELAARRDPFQTPEQRNREFMAKAVVQLTKAQERELAGISDKATRVEHLEAMIDTRRKQINASLEVIAGKGVTIDDILSGGTEIRLKGAKIIDNQLADYSDKERQAIKLAQTGTRSATDIAKQTGLTAKQVEDLNDRFISELEAKLLPKTRAGATLENLDAEQIALLSQPSESLGAQPISEDAAIAEARKMIKAMGFVSSKDLGRMKMTKRKRPKLFVPPKVRAALAPTEAPTPSELPYPQPAEAPYTGRVLGQPGLPLYQEMMVRKGADISNPDDVATLGRIISAAANGNRFDMLYEAWLANILSGPTTHLSYKLALGMNMGLEFSIQRGVEALVNLAVRDPKSAQLGEFKYLINGLIPGLTRGLGLGVRQFGTEAEMLRDDVLNQQIEAFPHGPGRSIFRPAISERPFSQFFQAGDKTVFARGLTATGENIDDLLGRLGKFNPARGRVIRLPHRVLYFVQGFYAGLGAQMNVAAFAYRQAKAEGLTGQKLSDRINELVATPNSEPWQRAVDASDTLTFRQKIRTKEEGGNFLENAIAQFMRARSGSHLLGTQMPFIELPFNLFRTGIRKTPFGTANLLSRVLEGGFFKMKDGKPFFESYPKAEFVRHMAEQAIAWATAAFLWNMAWGDDDDDKKLIVATGGMPTSTDQADMKKSVRELYERAYGGPTQIIIGGRNGVHIPYGKYEPIATVLGTVVNTIHQLKHLVRGEENIGQTLSSIWAYSVAQAEEKTFLRGLSRMMEMISHPSQAGGEAKRLFFEALVPNLIRQPLRNLDDYIRSYRSAPTAYSSFPSGALAEPKVNVYGEPLRKQGNAFTRMFFVAGTRPDPVLQKADQLLLKYNLHHPQTPYAPSVPQTIYKDGQGKDVQMTPGQSTKFLQTAGRRFAQMLRGQITDYQIQHPTEDDIKRIKELHSNAVEQIRREMFPKSEDGRAPLPPKRTTNIVRQAFANAA